MSEERRKGWHPDPFGIHKERYYYAAGRPGRLVRDSDRVESYDDIPEWAQIAEDDIPAPVARVRLMPPSWEAVPSPESGIAAAEASTSAPLPIAVPDQAAFGGAALTGASLADIGGPSVPLPQGAETSPPKAAPSDYFPDERAPWHVRAGAGVSSLSASSFSSLRKVPRPSRRIWYTVGIVGIAVLVAAVLFIVWPGGSHSPGSAQPTVQPTGGNPLSHVPTDFLNGGSGDPAPASTTPSSDPATTTAADPPVAGSGTAGSWSVSQTFGASSMNLSAIACPSPAQCLAVGETTYKTGMVLTSADGGSTWTQHNVPSGVVNLNAIACPATNTCIAVGGTSAIVTTDGGSTWTLTTVGHNELTAVSCPSASACVAAGSDPPVVSGCQSGSSYTTTNAGKSWTTTPTHCFVPSGIDCAAATICIMVGSHGNGTSERGAVLKSVNSGTTWRPQLILSQTNTQLNAVACPSATSCVAVGNSPTQSILTTADGGTSWTPRDPGVAVSQRYFLAVACGSTQACQAAGTTAPVATTDGGTNWANVSTPNTIAKIVGISCSTSAACVGVATSTAAAAAIKLS